MTDQAGKRAVHSLLLALVATIEGNLLTVGDETRVDITELALETLLLDGEASKGPAEASEDETGRDEVAEHHHRALRPDGPGQLAREDDDVQQWLAEVREQLHPVLVQS